MARSAQSEFNCSICNKPVQLETAKVDHNGKAVHAECYARTIVSNPSIPSPINRLPVFCDDPS